VARRQGSAASTAELAPEEENATAEDVPVRHCSIRNSYPLAMIIGQIILLTIVVPRVRDLLITALGDQRGVFADAEALFAHPHPVGTVLVFALAVPVG